MIASLRRGRIGEAVWRMLVWAAALAVCATALSYFNTTESGRLFIRGEIYRREMFEYLLTGFGPEGDIRRFLPVHMATRRGFARSRANGSLLESARCAADELMAIRRSTRRRQREPCWQCGWPGRLGASGLRV